MFIQTAQAAGVIDDAPTFADVLLNAFTFLLQFAVIVGIIGVVMTGLLYFFANGDRKLISVAKKISMAMIIGFVILFGAWIVLRTIVGFFSEN